jgi:protein-tyrosine phosphatase/membrane-associated phospholipid phosphatase
MTTASKTPLPPDRPSFKSRALWAAGASALFMVLYQFCLWFTARRADVPTLYFDWERHIPYVPWMIWPYLSIDAFFVASFFVCRGRGELTALGRRLVLATVVATVCFLCFPLRFAFDVPPTPGFVGEVIARFRQFDQPYNLAPSLHIAYRSILWVVYVRHTRGAVRLAVKAWFLLIGLSTLLVYQHHVIDVAAGLMLAMACLYVIPESRPAVPRGVPRSELAQRFGAVAAACALVALLVGGWAFLMLWPAASLAMVARAYATGDADVFRKRDGRLLRSTRVVHAPYLLLHALAWWIQQRGRPATSVVAPNVTIGRLLSRRELAALAPAAVIDLTAELDSPTVPGVRTISLPQLDLTLPTAESLGRVAVAVESAAAAGPVYVHCALGYARSALVAAAYLIASGQAASADEAVERITTARNRAVFSPRAVELLRQFAANRARTPELVEA